MAVLPELVKQGARLKQGEAVQLREEIRCRCGFLVG